MFPIIGLAMNDGKRVILAVDDEAIILWGTASLLETLGYCVIRASSGRAALETLQARHDVDILLTDYQMPSMSGLDLATAAQQIRPNLPVVIATGRPTLGNGANPSWAVLAKPFTSDELENVLELVLAENQAGEIG